MIQKIRDYLNTHEKQYELLRYLIAGGLTTLLSMLIHYAGCFIMAPKEPMSGSVLHWVIATINRATGAQMAISSAVSCFPITRAAAMTSASFKMRTALTVISSGSPGPVLTP